MGKGIRGIIVEIGGDTTKLGKAIDDASRKSQDLQKELKGVNSLLKMDPSNVTLLKQKQDLLNKSIANTKEKLETLKEAQKQVQAQFDKGEITEEQFRDFQREIVATEQKLEKLTDEFKEFGSVGAQQVAQAGEQVASVGGKIEKVGKGLSKVSAGTGAILASSIVAFKELDSGYDTIITKTGATGEELEELNAVADNIFGSMPTDMDTVSIAVGEINTRFGFTGEKLETLSRQFIQFAEINGVDLNNSIGTVNKIIEQFNLTGEDASGVLDLITLKAQQTGISADTLMKNIQDNGATFKDMGIGVNEAVVLLSQFEANGVNVETALKGLKKATVEYAKDGLSMEEGLAKTIDSIKNAKTETEALAEVEKLFGAKGANEMVKAIREGRINVDDLSSSMEDYAGVVNNTYEGTLDPIDQGTVAMNNLKLAGSELGGALQTAVAPVLTKLVDKLKTLVSWFSNLSPGMKNTILIILGVVTAIGPLILIIGQLITSVGTIMTFAPKLVTAFNGIKTAFTALGTAFTANPIGIIIVAVTALIGIFIALWNNCEGFRNFWIGLWEKIKNVVSVVGEWLKETWETIVTFFSTSIDSIKNFFVGLWDSVVSIFTNVKNWIITNIAQPIADFYNKWIAPVINKIVEMAKKVVEIIVAIFVGLYNLLNEKVIQPIITIFKNAWDSITSVFGKAWTWVNDNIVTPISNAVSSMFNKIKNVASSAWEGIKSAFSKVGSWFSNTFSSAWEAVKKVFSKWGEFFSGLWTKIKDTFSTIGTNIANAISGAVKSGINGVISAIERTINRGVGLINGAIDLINKLPGVSVSKINELSLPRLARGAVVTRPTVAEIGEDGAEAIIPLENNTEWLNKVANRLNNRIARQGVGNGDTLLEKLDRIYEKLERINPKQQIVLDSGVLVGETIGEIDAGLASLQLLKGRGV